MMPFSHPLTFLRSNMFLSNRVIGRVLSNCAIERVPPSNHVVWHVLSNCVIGRIPSNCVVGRILSNHVVRRVP